MSGRYKGLGSAVRKEWASGQNEVNPQQQLQMFYIGIIMDDVDEQRLGRLWVRLHTQSSAVFRNRGNRVNTPLYGSTTPDRNEDDGSLEWNQELRQGWIRCTPIFPVFGSDDYRTQSSTDGDNRNSQAGHVQSYGFWGQPRVGDTVGVLFADGDPAKAYWIGCAPKFDSNFMVPGAPGRPKSELDSKQRGGNSIHPVTEQFRQQSPDNALIPSLDKTRNYVENTSDQAPSQNQNQNASDVALDPELTQVLVQRDFAENLREAGLLCDPVRGASVSSSRRESPSYVSGFKTPGWSYDSEKNNINFTSGNKFKNDKATGGSRSKFDNVNTLGHQFVMDDHPETQGVRLRTSAGSQIYMNDSCDQPFIYISTARGKVWVELVDDKGDINVFGEGSFSLHARKDINLVADRDLNIDVQRDFNVLVRRDSDVALKGNVNVELNKNDSPPGDLNYDSAPTWGNGTSLGGNTVIQNYGSLDMTVGDLLRPTAAFKFNTTGDLDVVSGGTVHMQSTLDFHIFALGGFFAFGSTGANISAGSGTANIQSAGGFNVLTGGTFNIGAALILLNTGAPTPATPAVPGIAASTISNPLALSPVARPPTDTEKTQCQEPPDEFDTLPGSVVPQHQPWPNRCQQTIGLRGFISESSANVSRFGASTLSALAPITLLGSPNPGDPPGLYQAVPYSGNSVAEAPQYIKIRDPEPGELDVCTNFTASDKLVRFLKQHEAVRNKAYLDAGGQPTIGIGHLIVAGDVIFGDTINGTVTRDDIIQLRRDRGNLRISDEEVDRLFRLDLARFEKGVCQTITSEITQDQFDAMVSLSYNIGNGAFSRSSAAKAVNENRLRDVPQTWMRWITVSGVNNQGLVNRRRAELATFWDSGNLVA